MKASLNKRKSKEIEIQRAFLRITEQKLLLKNQNIPTKVKMIQKKMRRKKQKIIHKKQINKFSLQLKIIYHQIS